jgi:hypothetical protein
MGASAPRTLGHKNKCQYANCNCEKCEVTISRRQGTAVEQQQRRNPNKNVKRLIRSRKSSEKVENILDAVKDKLESIINKCYKINGGNTTNDEMVINELRGLLNTVEIGLDEDLKQMTVFNSPPQIVPNYDCNLIFIYF